MDPESVSKFLVDKGYLLTALEFYAELCEGGTQLKSLQDYFANAANFELGQTERERPSPGGAIAAVAGRRGHCAPFIWCFV